MTGGGYDSVPVLSAFLLALVVQQLATAALVRAGVPSLAPDAEPGRILPRGAPRPRRAGVRGRHPGRTLAGAAVVLQLLASLGIGWALSGEAAAGIAVAVRRP